MAYTMMDGPGMGYGIGLMWLWQLLIVLLLVAIIWYTLRQVQQPNTHESAQDILKKRLARGEITDKEYRKLKKEIE